MPQIRGAPSGFHRHYSLKPPGQRQREQSRSRIEIPGCGSAGFSDCQLRKPRYEEPVYLEERCPAYLEQILVYRIFQRTRYRARNLCRQPVEEPLCHRLIAFEHVPLHLAPIRKDFKRSDKPGPSAVPHHAIELEENLVDPGRTDGTLIDRGEAARVHLAISDATTIEMKLRPVAIPERLGALDPDLPGIELDLPHAPQCFDENVTLEAQLRLICGVLILAPSASAEYRTRRLHAIRRRLFDMQQARPLDVLSCLGSLGLDCLTRQDERREDDFAIQSAKPFTAVNQLFNAEPADLKR